MRFVEDWARAGGYKKFQIKEKNWKHLFLPSVPVQLVPSVGSAPRGCLDNRFSVTWILHIGAAFIRSRLVVNVVIKSHAITKMEQGTIV